jgi:hypothetical protein
MRPARRSLCESRRPGEVWVPFVLRGLFAPRAAISLRLTRIHGPG